MCGGSVGKLYETLKAIVMANHPHPKSCVGKLHVTHSFPPYVCTPHSKKASCQWLIDAKQTYSPLVPQQRTYPLDYLLDSSSTAV